MKTFLNQIEAARASFIYQLFARTRPRNLLVSIVEDTARCPNVDVPFFWTRQKCRLLRNGSGSKGFFVPLYLVLRACPVAFDSAFVVVQGTVESNMSDDPTLKTG